MTVSSATSKISYSGNGSSTQFATPYFINNADLVVVLRDSDGTETTQTITTHYTLSGAGTEAGGTVTMLTAPASGKTLVIYRDPVRTQTVDYNDQDEFPASTTERALDRGIMIDQRLYDLIIRSLRLKETDTVGSGTYQAGSQRITGVGAGTQSTDAVNLSQVQAFLTNLTQYATSGVLAHYASRTTAAATSIPTLASWAVVEGYSSAGDFGHALYKKLGSAPSPQKSRHFQSTDGAWWEIVIGTGINAAALGFSFGSGKSSGVRSSNATILQDAIDCVYENGGGTCTLKGASATCEVSLAPQVKANVKLDLCGSLLHQYLSGGFDYGARIAGDYATICNGTIKTFSSGSPSLQGIIHAGISIGYAYSDPDDGGPDDMHPHAFLKGWHLHDLVVDTTKSVVDGIYTWGGQAIAMFGGINHGVIERITIPDSSVLRIGIGADWGFTGPIVSSTAGVVASRVYYDAGEAYNILPNHIVIQDINIGSLTQAVTGGEQDTGSHGIRLSGVHNFTVRRVKVKKTNSSGFMMHGGDAGYEFALGQDRRHAAQNIVIEDYEVWDAGTGWGFRIDTYNDNVAAAVATLSYSPIANPIYETNLVLRRCFTDGPNTSGGKPGFYLANTIGARVEDCYAAYHEQGVHVDSGGDQVQIIGCTVKNNRGYGISIDHDTGNDKPDRCLVSRNYVRNNNTDSGTPETANIYVGLADNTEVSDNLIGGASGEACLYGVYVHESSSYTRVYNNDVVTVATGGFGYRLGTGSNFECLWEVRGNKHRGSSITAATGITIIPETRDINISNGSVRTTAWAQRGSLTADTTPPYGSWGTGSIIWYVDPVAGGFAGTRLAGSDWKRFGAIEA